MSLRFADSFSRYKLGTTSDPEVLGGLSAYWTSIAFSTCSIGTGVFGFNSQFIALGAGVSMFKTLTQETGWTVAWRYQVNPGTAGNLFTEMIVERNTGQKIIGVQVNIDGTLGITLGGISTVLQLTPTTGPLHFNKPYHFELNYDLTPGASTVFLVQGATLTVDGEVLNINLLADMDTGVPLTALVNGRATVNVHGITASFATNYLDDYVIFDHNGAHNNNTIGDVKILGIRPNGDTSVKDFTPSTGTTHFSLINFTPPTGDPSSLFSDVVNDKDIWDWENIPSFSGTISGVSISIYARKDDEGSRSFKIVTGNTGSEEQSTERFLNDNYVYHHHEQDVNPATGVPYTVTNFNSKRFGVEVIS